jgi:hypothetical protein
MKNLEIRSSSFTELTKKEQQEITGGNWGVNFWGPVLAQAVKEIVSDWDNFKRGLTGQPEVRKGLI